MSCRAEAQANYFSWVYVSAAVAVVLELVTAQTTGVETRCAKSCCGAGRVTQLLDGE